MTTVCVINMDESAGGSGAVFDVNKLNNFKKAELVELVVQLQKEKQTLQNESEFMKNIAKRVTELERSHNLYLQYGRRESVEISGIPAEVQDDELEDAVIQVYDAAKVEVDGVKLHKSHISACHRIGKKGNVIVRFPNRKFSYAGLFNGKNLKGTTLFGDSPIYINNSFCKEFGRFGAIIRKLKRDKRIHAYRIKHGVYNIQLSEANTALEQIAHISDFEKCGLDVSGYESQPGR